jgi:hypothetical protein
MILCPFFPFEGCASPFQQGLDLNGSKVIAWQEDQTDSCAIFAKVYTLFTGWTKATQLSTSETSTHPIVAVIANRRDIAAVVIWKELIDENQLLFASMFPDSEIGWTHAVQISPDGESVTGDYIASVDGTNSKKFHVLATWTAYDAEGNKYVYNNTADLDVNNSWYGSERL